MAVPVQTERPVFCLVRKERLELSRLAALEPKSSAYTNFATSAVMSALLRVDIKLEYPTDYMHNQLIILE